MLLKSGNTQGTTTEGVVYSTDKEVEDLLAASANAEEFKANLKLKFKQEIEAEIVYILNDPSITPNTLGNSLTVNAIPDNWISILSREIFLFEPDTAQWLGVALVVLPESDPVVDPLTRTTMYRNWAPSVLGWHRIDDLHPSFIDPKTKAKISSPASIKMLAYRVSHNRPGSWIQDHPRKALLEMLKLGHAEQPELIGPPYVILHVSRQKGHKQEIRWIQRGVCPSWDEKVPSESWLRDLRNP